MKYHFIAHISILLLAGGILASCSDFLNQEPPSDVTPEDYYTTEDQVQSVANAFYQTILPYHNDQGYGTFDYDNGTDNQAGNSADTKYVKGLWKVGSDNGSWYWNNIRDINYQLNKIVGNYTAKKISGTDKNIRQYIGELYFFRAYAYFSLLRSFGDLPIIKTPLKEEEGVLVDASKRSPRNEVARFILEDLDSAALMMTDGFEARHTRLSPAVAHLVSSRVALFEGAWLTNFKNTPFVPGGPGWPGAEKDYNKDFKYKEGDIDKEAQFFFQKAADEAEVVADKYAGSLDINNGVVPQKESDDNPYFYKFGSLDMSGYPDVLLWREYNKSKGITNNVEVAVQYGDIYTGFTRGMIDAFLMKDGKPTYATHDGGYTYKDGSTEEVVENRDPRLAIFLKRPGQKNVFKNMDYLSGDHIVETEPVPNIISHTFSETYVTGYAMRKGGSFDRKQCENQYGATGSITFRATEALLNYIEAEYMLTKNINSGKIISYWETLRKAAGFTGTAVDPRVTIAATDMSQETKGLQSGTQYDWGAFTAGKPVDATLYSIRRERRCELMAEGLRWMDLIRWRSLDQLKQYNYHIEGVHIWNSPMESWYKPEELVGNGTPNATVSSKDLSEYLRPYEIYKDNNSFYNGFTWAMAQYLQPLPIRQFLLTASDHATPALSPLYQNPYWPLKTDEPAEQ